LVIFHSFSIGISYFLLFRFVPETAELS